jgi:hypothetical protein
MTLRIRRPSDGRRRKWASARAVLHVLHSDCQQIRAHRHPPLPRTNPWRGEASPILRIVLLRQLQPTAHFRDIGGSRIEAHLRLQQHPSESRLGGHLARRWCRRRPTSERDAGSAKQEVERSESSAATQVSAIRTSRITRAHACVIRCRAVKLVVAAPSEEFERRPTSRRAKRRPATTPSPRKSG